MSEPLKDKLQALHSALQQVNNLDNDTRQLLQTLNDDIARVTAGNPPPENLTERIEQQTVQFEGEHPQMSAILRDIIDVLGKMGI